MKPRRMYNGRSGKVNPYFSRIVACRLRKRDRILAAMHDGTLSTSFAPFNWWNHYLFDARDVPLQDFNDFLPGPN